MSYYLLLNWRNVRHHPDPFEYMSHYLSQTQKIDEDMRSGLNICRIAFYSNYNVIEVFSNEFEYMSYYLFAQTPVRRGKSLDSLNICRITFCSNYEFEQKASYQRF